MKEEVKWRSESCSVVSNSLRPHGLYDPWNSLSQNSLEWIAFPFSRGSSQPRDRTHVSCIGRRVLYQWATREAHVSPPLFLQLSFLSSLCHFQRKAPRKKKKVLWPWWEQRKAHRDPVRVKWMTVKQASLVHKEQGCPCKIMRSSGLCAHLTPTG